MQSLGRINFKMAKHVGLVVKGVKIKVKFAKILRVYGAGNFSKLSLAYSKVVSYVKILQF